MPTPFLPGSQRLPGETKTQKNGEDQKEACQADLRVDIFVQPVQFQAKFSHHQGGFQDQTGFDHVNVLTHGLLLLIE